MSESFFLQDNRALIDLQTYLARASRAADGAVRLIASSGVIAAYTAILSPRGLTDTMPTVLGLRTFATRPETQFDSVVPLRSLSDRLARVRDINLAVDNGAEQDDAGVHDAAADRAESFSLSLRVGLPLPVATVMWAAISPPRGGWREVGHCAGEHLMSVARDGIAEVAEALPTNSGEHLVYKVRSEVWSRPIPELDFVPSGAAFAAHTLGFLAEGDDTVTVFENGSWTRLTTRRGHVLVHRPAWSLQV